MKKIITILLAVLLTTVGMVAETLPVLANTQKVDIVINPATSNNFFPKSISLNEVAIKSGGTVDHDKVRKIYNFYINGKSIKIFEGMNFAEVDGVMKPFGATHFGTDYTFHKPVYLNSEVYVPSEFITLNIGLALKISDTYVEFEDSTIKNPAVMGDKINIAMNKQWVISFSKEIQTGNNIDVTVFKGEQLIPFTTKISSNKMTIIPGKLYEPNTRYSIKIALAGEKSYTMSFTTANAPKITDTAISYTGGTLKTALIALGFADVFGNGKLLYNSQDIPNGQSTFIQYQELAGEFDMSLYISNSFMNSKDYDMLTNKIFSKINTSNGGLFQYIDLLEEGQKSIKTMQSGTITSIAPKTVQFGRRKVKMEVDLYGVKLTMGPIINK